MTVDLVIQAITEEIEHARQREQAYISAGDHCKALIPYGERVGLERGLRLLMGLKRG